MPPPEMLEARPTLGDDGQVSWELCYKAPPGGQDQCGDSEASYPPVELDAKSGPHMFHVSITNDNTGLGIKFANEPIWIRKDDKPTASVVDSQIDNITGAGTTQLNFRDTNSNLDPILLKYRLNFVDQANQEVTPLDPDIKNGGSGHGVTQSNFLADTSSEMIIGLAVLLFLLGGFVGALIAKRAG